MTDILLTIFIVAAPADDAAVADDRKRPVGCEVGAEVPPFYVREINSARPNLAVCLVCKNGARPTVMIAARELDSQVGQMLEAVDRALDRHRADGLRGFAIFLAPDANRVKELQPRLFTLARDRQLTLPLTIPVESATGPASLALPRDAQTTVLFYTGKTIVARSLFRAGELTPEKMEQVVRDAELLVSKKNPADASAKQP